MDTTTTTTIKPTSKSFFLNEFLDTHSLTRAERSYYLKHNTALSTKQKTISEWEKIIKIKK